MALKASDLPKKPKAPRQKKLYTVAEWLKFDEERPYTELVDGVPVRMPNSTHNHWQIIFNVLSLLSLYVRGNNLGKVAGEVNVIIEGVTGRNGWIPDGVFANKDSTVRVGANWMGVPDWVLEVWAASEQKPARIGEKRARWQRAGVKELWEIITGKDEQTVNVYRLDEQGIYQKVAIEGEKICSEVISGFCMSRAEIFADLVPEE